MTSDWQQVRDLFARALDVDAEERQAFLDRECGGDEMLRREIESLLRAHRDDSFLAQPASVAATAEPVLMSLGDFDIREEIGRGGMGVVYLARQRSLQRDVALKVLQGPVLADRARVDRFHREAQAAGKLSHDHIVPVFADGQTEQAHWFAMRHVPGHDLHEELERQRKNLPNSPPLLPPPNTADHVSAVVALVADVADALHHAHRAGVVHRDVKPHNILIDAVTKKALLADFGLARDDAAGSLTATGVIAGTPFYMSPEQARAYQTRVDHRTDVYSLGVVLYEMLTLTRPFEASTADEIRVAFLTREAPPLRRINPRVPVDLETICHQAMAKDVKDRYETAAALGDDLRRFLAGTDVRARRPGPWSRVRAMGRRRGSHLIVGSLIVISLVAGAAWAGWTRPPAAGARLRIVAADGGTLPGATTVRVRPIDLVTTQPGAVSAVLSLAGGNAMVDPGYVRLAVAMTAEPMREFTRMVRADQDTEVRLPLPCDDSPSRMVLIVGGTLSVAADGPMQILAIAGQRVEVADFYIDEAEVSNRQYGAFLTSTGHAPPPHWTQIQPQHEDLPVVNVTWEDARAYAEWARKRLPTFAEWTWAARGVDNRIYPWPEAVKGQLRGNCRYPRLAALSYTERVAEYLERAAGVQTFADARTPEGLWHMFGNVSEWTESLVVRRSAGTIDVEDRLRLVAGHCWCDGARHDLSTYGLRGTGEPYRDSRIGFRCARSATSR